MNTILLGNLIKIRWIAIIGQLVAIFFVKYLINIDIPFYESLAVILLSVIINFYSLIEERKINQFQILKLFYFYYLIHYN